MALGEHSAGFIPLHLPKYIGNGNSPVLIKPSLDIGIRINGVALNSKSIQGVKDLTGARFIQIIGLDGKPIKVIEHLVSAVNAAGIFHADITVKNGLTPVVGPGISNVYNILKDQNFEPQERENIKFMGNGPIKIESELFPGASIIVESSNTFDIAIQTRHKDLADIGAKPLFVEDVYEEIKNNLHARPIARLQNHVTFSLFQILNKRPFNMKGIGELSYIMARPGESGDQIVEQMLSQYQEGRNEHLAHTVFADFFGEVHTFFPGKIQAKFTLNDTNHISRVELLRKLFERNIILPLSTIH